MMQGGITCGAIDEPRISSKAIDEGVIINFCDTNVVIVHFCDKNVVIARMFGVFAIDEILRYRGSPFTASRTLCHPKRISWQFVVYPGKYSEKEIVFPEKYSFSRSAAHRCQSVTTIEGIAFLFLLFFPPATSWL